MKRSITLAALAGTVLALSACSSQSGGGSPSSGSSSGAAYTIAYSSPWTQNDFQNSFQCGMVAAAKKFGVKLSVSGSPQYAPSAQIPVLNAAAALHPDALVTSPTNIAGLKGTLQQIKANGTKVVLYDSGGTTMGGTAAGAVTTDAYQGGELAGKEVVKVTGGKGVILVIDGQPGTPSTNDRVDGVLKVLKGEPGLTILPTQYDQSTPANDTSIVNAELAAHPNIAAIVPSYDTAAEAVVTTLQADNKLSSTKIVSFDADPKIVDYVKQGIIEAIVNQTPYAQASTAMQMAINAVKGKKNDPAVKQIPMQLVTKSNLSDPTVSQNFYVAKGCTV